MKRWVTRRVHIAALVAALPSCQQCLDFDCSGGFELYFDLSDFETVQSLQVEIATPDADHLHTCALQIADGVIEAVVCQSEVTPRVEGTREVSVIETFARGRSGTEVSIETRTPNENDAFSNDVRGPAELSVVVSADGKVVYDEAFELVYDRQLQGRRCGVCEHGERRNVVLEP